ncbi:MAG: hypothetical protein MH204_11630, partial [Fimbriimonadaceae bacterium]|nr:hypothetical protein [Fimbriimonadaceae bacterium]
DQNRVGVTAYDFRIGYGARLILSFDGRELKGSGSILNFLNLGGSRARKLRMAATFQIVGISGPAITQALPPIRLVAADSDLQETLNDFNGLIKAIADSLEADEDGGIRPKPGIVCRPTILGAVEYVPGDRVGDAVGSGAFKGS